ncbi:MAG: hypothetical protein AB7N76_28740 [Planctomycetota bacterium]
MEWSQVLNVIAEACESQGEERHVLLVTADASFHVKEPLSRGIVPEGGLLGFVVYADDPALSQKTDATRLIFVPPAHVLRILVQGAEAQGSGGFGFAT